MKTVLTLLLFINWSLAKAQLKPDTSVYAVMDIQTMKHPIQFDSGYHAAGLTDTELVELEAILVEAINRYNAETKQYYDSANYNKRKNRRMLVPLISLPNYKRQYVVCTNPKGEKEIWVNCFCGPATGPYRNWRREIIQAMDGGSCFFNLGINLATRESAHIQVNGIA